MGAIDSLLFGEGGFEARVPEIEESLGEGIRVAWNATGKQFGRRVGGKLLLTDRQLVFYPQRIESGEGKRAVLLLGRLSPGSTSPRLRGDATVWGATLDSIEDVGVKRGIRSHLLITLEDGGAEVFLVNKLQSESYRESATPLKTRIPPPTDMEHRLSSPQRRSALAGGG